MFSFGCVLFTALTTNIFCSVVDGSSYLNKLVLKSSLKDIPNPGICSQEARCEPIQNFTCFGTVLPYLWTSIALADDSISQLEIQDNLALWQGLRSVPRCWAVVQPLLCSVYMPKCENQSLFLPSQEMCRITRSRCRAVEVQHGWPPFLQCENKKLFPPGCRNPLQEVKFNTSFKCIRPLVETDNSDRWYSDVEGCGLQCQNPLFSKEQHEQVHNFIRTLAIISFCANFVTVLTFAISWKVSNRYPAVIICYINLCLLVASCGWLIQLIPGAKEEIVCREDGTRRRVGESRLGSTPAHLCNFTFILIYAPSMAALICFVILAYTWYVLFRQSGVPEGIGKIWQWRNLFALFVPVVLTVIVFYVDAIESDSVSGVCFVGSNPSSRGWFLLLPVLLVAVVGGVFLTGGICALINLKRNSEEVANGQMKKQIHCMIIRIGIFSFFSLFFVISTIVCHVYEFVYREEWEKYLREYIVCLATASVTRASCALKHHPNIHLVQLRLFSLFGFSILMASWVWTPATVQLWKQVLYRCCRSKGKDDSALKKHQVIAKAFQHKQEVNEGHFSFIIKSTQEDPIGMNLDVNSITSREVSSSWTAALPNFLNRRNAVAGIDPLRLPQQYSSASDVSIQHISLDSFHQANLDSLSQHMSEQEYAHVLRQQRRKTRKERKRFLTANRVAAWYPRNRRGSDTSLQSSIIAASVAAAVANASGGKVTQATSTGDLNNVVEALFPRLPTSCVVNRPLAQRQIVPNLPFTHGMTDYSHSLDARAGGASTTQSLNLVPQQNSAAQSPFAALYNQAYGFMPQVPFGYLPSAMYQSLFPGYMQMMAGNIDCTTYNPLNYFPYGQFTVPTSVENPTQTPIIPLHPTVDSASETEYFPIILSDSDFTDGGHHSYDGAQLLSAQRWVQKQPSQNTSTHCDPPQSRPMLEPQSCAKTQFLKKIEATAQHSQTKDLPAGEKLSHSEAPPPSPADSDQEDPTEGHCLNGKDKLPKSLSRESLKSVEAFLAKVGDAFTGVKTKIKRASSFPHGIVDDDIELNLKTSHVSLRCASNNRTEKGDQCDETSVSLLHPPNNSNCRSGKLRMPGYLRAASENVSR